jgi:hypothetical protein
MGTIGMPELVIMLVGLVFWIVPLLAGIYALITLIQIRRAQEDVVRKLEAIERALLATKG